MKSQSEKTMFFYSYFNDKKEDILFPILEETYLGCIEELDLIELENGCKKMNEYESFSKECYVCYWNKKENKYSQVYDEENTDLKNWRLTMIYEQDYGIKQVFHHTNLNETPKLQDLVFLTIHIDYRDVFSGLLTGKYDIRN